MELNVGATEKCGRIWSQTRSETVYSWKLALIVLSLRFRDQNDIVSLP